MTPSLYDVINLGIKTYGEPDSTDGLYELNGCNYVVTGDDVILESDID